MVQTREYGIRELNNNNEWYQVLLVVLVHLAASSNVARGPLSCQVSVVCDSQRVLTAQLDPD